MVETESDGDGDGGCDNVVDSGGDSRNETRCGHRRKPFNLVRSF